MPKVSPDRTSTPPRWVKGFAVAAVVALALAAAMIAGGHGPWRHFAPAGSMEE